MSECLKYQKPDNKSMEYAIISHNIDFISFLMNEYNLRTSLTECGWYNYLDAFLVYFDQTNDLNRCFIHSVIFNLPSFYEYFLSIGANINGKMKIDQRLIILQQFIIVKKKLIIIFPMMQI
ncbi:hypothetical protein TVAG_093430 [Trichomonas vaginalis G3]|uniref:DUF3447 domain-containing protein n=1 Tax=Trichomonas vaginalis (strain ATCC PRA-98 / G3) TaxID=412133 RepID=A2DBG6_TRIV3|nr:protein of unknown function (DUF3447) [Trichomonas vaginalis G3]EAY22169.1 hypothetical protein TVAG_093430 [Trichomonas vaginalis G3]KAI5533373.1 protein of unknown function (DUF3447) [Trichomonas vaginalis G3]|eukprot:XP_001583155.1 hypothetical protein [Trichomonas vaginalis G3]